MASHLRADPMAVVGGSHIARLPCMDMHDYMHDWGGWGIMMGLFWVAILIAVIALVAWLAGSRGLPRASDESPEAILKRRYARGEISREQYEDMLRDLRR